VSKLEDTHRHWLVHKAASGGGSEVDEEVPRGDAAEGQIGDVPASYMSSCQM